MGELDAAGNVNVSRLGSKVVGPGGFVDIAQNARKLVFCGTFDGKGTEYDFAEGRIALRRAGDLPKLVPNVREITFSAEVARARGQDVVYVTERAVFRLGADGVELTELAPGLDLERDVLARAGFRPVLRGTPAPMPARHFEERRDGRRRRVQHHRRRRIAESVSATVGIPDRRYCFSRPALGTTIPTSIGRSGLTR